MQKRYYKMTLSMLITTVLLLSIVPLYMAIAITAVTLTNQDPEDGDNVGDYVLVEGEGASAGVLVSIYWDKVLAANKLNETWADGFGVFDCYVTIPEDVVGSHYIIASDGRTDAKSALFTIDPKITLTPDAGLKDDIVTVKGTGFASEEDITLTWNITTLTTTPSTVTTSTKGSFSCTFKVPDATYGTYTVTAKDESLNSASASFKVGATITLTPAEGPSGTVVDITGRGFTKTSGLTVTITIDTTTAEVVADIKTRSDGKFTGEFIVPTLAVGTYTVTAKDPTYTATLDFEVTGTTEITLSPTSGAPGDSVTIEGINFTAIADTEVTIDFGTLTDYATLKTNSTGGFKGTMTVPSLAPNVTDPYDVDATDEYGLNATAEFIIALVTLAISPTSGPTGKKVLVIGSGFTPDTDFNVTIDGELAVDGEGIIDPDGGIPDNTNVYVPTVSTGVKKLTVMDAEGVSKSVNFEVTKTTELILTPSSGPVGYNITIELHYFTAAADIGIDVLIYNSTYDETLNGKIKRTPPGTVVTVETNATGSFIGWFEVPDTLALGNYKINATDENDLGVWEKPFNVVTVTLEVTTSAAEYLRGQDVTFRIKSSFPSEGEIVVTDPADFEQSLDIEEDDYQKIGDWQYAYISMVLRSDAPLGTWSWEATVEEEEVSGTFKVSEVPTLETLSTRIADLEESVATVSDIVDELSSTIEAQAADITAISESVSDLASAVDALTADLADVASAAAAAQTAASNAATAATEAATAASGAAEAAQSAQSAAEAAQSTAAGISTAVYGAMALSLVAAIAAIVAVITLQRKVAG